MKFHTTMKSLLGGMGSQWNVGSLWPHCVTTAPECPSGSLAAGVCGWELLTPWQLEEKQQGQHVDSGMVPSVAMNGPIPVTALVHNTCSKSLGVQGTAMGHSCSWEHPPGAGGQQGFVPHMLLLSVSSGTDFLCEGSTLLSLKLQEKQKISNNIFSILENYVLLYSGQDVQ